MGRALVTRLQAAVTARAGAGCQPARRIAILLHNFYSTANRS
jgi:hypothetical protein